MEWHKQRTNKALGSSLWIGDTTPFKFPAIFAPHCISLAITIANCIVTMDIRVSLITEFSDVASVYSASTRPIKIFH